MKKFKSGNQASKEKKEAQKNSADWDDSDYLEAPHKLHVMNDSGVLHLRIFCIFRRRITFRSFSLFCPLFFSACWLAEAGWDMLKGTCMLFKDKHTRNIRARWLASFSVFRISVYRQKPLSRNRTEKWREKNDSNMECCHRRYHTPLNRYIIYFLVSLFFFYPPFPCIILFYFIFRAFFFCHRTLRSFSSFIRLFFQFFFLPSSTYAAIMWHLYLCTFYFYNVMMNLW